MMKWIDEQTYLNSQHSLLNGIAVTHSSILVPSLWRVLPITLSSQADMPSLITVALVKGRAFRRKKTIHTKSFSSSFTSFLDITPDLQYYLSLLSFTYNLHLCQFQSSPILSLVFTQINTFIVHSISIALIIAVELS